MLICLVKLFQQITTLASISAGCVRISICSRLDLLVSDMCQEPRWFLSKCSIGPLLVVISFVSETATRGQQQKSRCLFIQEVPVLQADLFFSAPISLGSDDWSRGQLLRSQFAASFCSPLLGWQFLLMKSSSMQPMMKSEPTVTAARTELELAFCVCFSFPQKTIHRVIVDY